MLYIFGQRVEQITIACIINHFAQTEVLYNRIAITNFNVYMEFEINNNMTESCNIINKIHILFAEKKTM